MTEWERDFKRGVYRAIAQKRREYWEDEGLIALLDALEGMLVCTSFPHVLAGQANDRIRPHGAEHGSE